MRSADRVAALPLETEYSEVSGRAQWHEPIEKSGASWYSAGRIAG
jgi:hypothetical protein